MNILGGKIAGFKIGDIAMWTAGGLVVGLVGAHFLKKNGNGGSMPEDIIDEDLVKASAVLAPTDHNLGWAAGDSSPWGGHSHWWDEQAHGIGWNSIRNIKLSAPTSTDFEHMKFMGSFDCTAGVRETWF